MPEEDRVDQTSNDRLTGADVVEGVLTLRRLDGSTETYSLVESLPTEDPETQGALWNDEGVVKMTYSLLPELPTADPEVVGALWNDDGAFMVSAGP